MSSTIRNTSLLLAWSILISCAFPTQLAAQSAIDDPAPIVLDPTPVEGDELTRLLDLDVGQLSQELASEDVFVSAPVLTQTKRNEVPAAVTHITHQMIQSSGARNLDELFEIYVPNVQVMRHGTVPHVGVRGIISEREDKYLLRVNGRIMNQRTHVGALSERDLPMLKDINYIDFVRGAGGAVYGPGAIAGVVNIVTLNGTTFQGFDVTARQGFEKYYTSAEIRLGRKFNDDTGLFLYYGVGNSVGADQSISPNVYGSSFITQGTPGTSVMAGTPVSFPVVNDGEAFDKEAWHKAHIQLTHKDANVWVRYTKGGLHDVPTRATLLGGATPPLSDEVGTESQYQQLTVVGDYHHEVSSTFDVDVSLSWDLFDFVKHLSAESEAEVRNHKTREDEYNARFLATWTPDEIHSIAMGYEYSYEIFGMSSLRHPSLPASTARMRPVAGAWSTDTHSLLGEYQLQLTENMTTYLGARTDTHTYSKTLFSPRVAVVYTIHDDSLIKFIASQAVRRAPDDDLQDEFLTEGTLGDPEVLKSLELRFESQISEPSWWAASLFYIDTDAVGKGAVGTHSTLLGNFEIWGVELETVYHTAFTRFRMSHSYTKLSDASVLPGTPTQGISAALYGFGHDLANWSNNLTKFSFDHDVNDRTSIDGSLQVYWGFPGGEDLGLYNALVLGGSSKSIALSYPGYTQSYMGNVYLNFGLERRPYENLVLRLDFYNVLGWLDKDLNKRNQVNRVSEYRAEAASIGISAQYGY